MTQKQTNHAFHMRRLCLFAVLLCALFVVRSDSDLVAKPPHQQVLAYATSMSRDGLLSGTNAARAANGLGNLTLHSQLNSSAQAKAQHMADNDYWAHVAPDGTQPWYFFNQAGYSYIRAGENLAYGFATSQGAVDGWMNSPTHRANILGDYVDVGFGIVNAPNYQSSGQQTIVVAHYGAKAAAPPAPAPAATAPPATPSTPAPTSPSQPPTVPSQQTPPVASEPESTTPAAKPADSPQPTEPAATPPHAVATAEPASVSVLSMLANRNVGLVAATGLALAGFAALGFALTHRAAFRRAVHAGEHYVIIHPGTDVAVIAAVTALIMLTTYGNIG